jgi:hypothetical protein
MQDELAQLEATPIDPTAALLGAAARAERAIVQLRTRLHNEAGNQAGREASVSGRRGERGVGPVCVQPSSPCVWQDSLLAE